MSHQPAHPMIEIRKVIELRDHHLREAKRCDDALALLRDVGRMVARADALTGKVRERAADHHRGPMSPEEAAARRDKIVRFLREKPNSRAAHVGAMLGVSKDRARQILGEMPEVEKTGLRAATRYRLKSKSATSAKSAKRSTRRSSSAGASARQRIAAANGTRPIDTVRRIMREHEGEAPISREALLKLSGFIGTAQGGPPNLDAEGKASRMLGLTLSSMIKRREIKRRGDGFVPYKLPAPVAADANGAQA